MERLNIMEQTYEIFYTDKNGEVDSVEVTAKGQAAAIREAERLRGRNIRVTAIYNV